MQLRNYWPLIFIVGVLCCSEPGKDQASKPKTDEYTAFYELEIAVPSTIIDTTLIGFAMDYALEYYDREDADASVMGTDNLAYIHAGEIGKITGNKTNRETFTMRIKVENQDSLMIISGSMKGKYTDTPSPSRGEYVDMAPKHVDEQEKYLKEWMEQMVSSFKAKNNL